MRQRIRERIALLRYLRYAHPVPRAAFVVLRVLEALVPAATALATAYVIAAAQGGNLAGPLALLGGILLAGQALDQAGQTLRLVLAGQIDGAHRAQLAALTVSGGSLETIERQDVRDLVRTATADPRDWIEKTPSDGALAEVEAATRYVGLVSSVGVLALWSPWLIIPLVAAAVLVRAITAMRWVEHYQVWARNLVDSRRYLYWGEISTSVAEAKEIRVFGFSEWLIGQHQHHMSLHLGPVWDDDRRAAKAWILRFVITVVPLAAVYFVVASGTGEGGRTVAAAAATFTAAWSLFTLMGGTATIIDAEGAKPVVRASEKLAAEMAAVRVPASRRPLEEPPLIRFDKVGFHYPGTSRPVLDGLDLELRPGELVALVGLNGAGKSTLTKLLAGLYAPACGRITANGIDIAEVDAWQDQLSIVFQDFLRYPFSLADNIAFGRPGRPVVDDDIRAAAREAGLEDVVGRLPQKWDTMLDRTRAGGVDLSGGQWQQVALARALYSVRRGAQVLVLDEPTAHLDVRTEFELFGRLTKAAHGLCALLITHRLWTVQHVDRIALLSDGRIAECGSHADLMAAGGRYAEMFELQAKRFRRGADDGSDEDGSDEDGR